MGLSSQEYWSGLPCPPPGNLPALGIEPSSLMSLALAGVFFNTSATRKAQLASIRQMSGQVSRGSAGEYQADEPAGVAGLSWRVSGR